MLLRFLRFIVPIFTFRVLFRRIYYINRHKAPNDKPLILAGNHPNSFLDGMLIGAYFGRPAHFLVRGDMFGNRLKRWLLRQLNIAPIYRIEEGYENVRKNKETFKAVHRVLIKNENLIIFGEGISVPEKRLRPLRKGIARIAFGAEEENDLDIHVVPVGINYTYPTRFRKEVMIRFHEPIRIKEMMPLYRENHAKAYISFNHLLEAALKKEVIIVEDKKNDNIAEHLFELDRNDNPQSFFRWKSDSDERLSKEKAIADKINNLSKNLDSKFSDLLKMVSDYFESLDNNSIKDHCLAKRTKHGWLRNLVFIIGWPIFFYGYFTNLLSFTVPKYICDKKIKQPQFYLAIFMGIGTVLHLLYFSLIIILLSISLGWWGVIIAISVPVTGYLALYYMEIWKERIQFFQYRRVMRKHPDLISEMLELRNNLKQTYSNL